ncbi:MAG: V-type ATP synthase subunit D [Candidatus Omnitrophica bacterium]|nr:V-type ATP synthase subunit D [Candidatus Omnitrophota bacterium]MDD5081285.1 V-type ATP synthase subunit D [Candidatus Omnitrophota bacterium]MDD5441438.1 V-type ATP synthase subunit D [Candidatus Omnitrophota bacterium]
MAKIKLTKSELKRQKDSLKRFNRYLPTLKLKKQQLQSEIVKVHNSIKELENSKIDIESYVYEWADVFSEKIDIISLIKISKVKVKEGSIAGIDIPIFDDVLFDEEIYDFYSVPLWVDEAVKVYKDFLRIKVKLDIAKEQETILREELRLTVQRVNLFEKVKIPETQENIRIINISLGDLQTSEVVRGKIAKSKLEKKKEMAAL